MVIIFLIVIICVGVYLIYVLVIANQPIESNSTDSTTSANVNMSDWQTYTNDQYGFNVKYPKDWKIKFNTPVNDHEIIDVSFDIRSRPERLVFMSNFSIDYVEDDIDNHMIINKEISVGGHKSYIGDTEIGIDNTFRTGYIDLKPGMLIIDAEGEGVELFDQILSTFRFASK